MMEQPAINVLMSPTGAAFPPTQRSAELIRNATQRNSAIPKTLAQPSPNKINRRLPFTASPATQGTQQGNYGTQQGTQQGNTKNETHQGTQQGTQQQGHGTGNRNGINANGTQHGTDKNNDTKTTQAFKRPAFLHTAGQTTVINMDSIIELTVGTFKCPSALQEKYIVSFMDRVVWSTEKHKTLRDILRPELCSQDLKKGIGDYFFAFGTRNECSDETDRAAAVATIMAISELSPANKILVQKALLYGVGLEQEQLQQAAFDVENGKQLGDRSAHVHDLDNVNMMGLLELITAVVCHSDSEAGGAILAIRNLFKIDFSECTRIIDALAIERRRWESAYRELGEAPLANFIRVDNFVSNISVCEQFQTTVQEFEFITAHRQEVKLSRIKEWGTVERLFVEAAVVAGRNETHCRDIDDDSSIGSGGSDDHLLSAHFSGVPISKHTGRELRPVFGGTRHRSTGNKEEDQHWKKRAEDCQKTAAKIEEIEADGKDITINCKGCKKEFVHTVEQQVTFASRGWENLPGQCATCKENKEPQSCFDFANGKCWRGDSCKFIHAAEGKLTSHAAGIEELDSDESDSDSLDLDCY